MLPTLTFFSLCSIPEVKENLDIELAYELEHNSVVCCVRYSNDGKYLATGCNRKAQIFSVETGEKVQYGLFVLFKQSNFITIH